MAVEPTFRAQLHAVLDEALALNREDPSLANFLVAVRTDTARHPELGADERLAPVRRGVFFGELIELGVRNGEVRPEDRETVRDVVAAVLMGLVSASSADPETHARAVHGTKRLIDGALIKTLD